MNLGNEILRDSCPQKYTEQGNLFKETLPVIVMLVLVSLWSGSLFRGGGISGIATLVIEIIFVFGMYAFVFFVFKGSKKRLAETYISICENGVCGVCPLNGFKNRDFCVYYGSITNVKAKKDQLFIYSAGSKTAVFTLHNASAAAALIQSRLNNK
ncbi:MAG: hypothetical protein IJO03_02530 [Clostridia bacterium]|nr:hypothetical protein [Clostridia bacterium]